MKTFLCTDTLNREKVRDDGQNDAPQLTNSNIAGLQKQPVDAEPEEQPLITAATLQSCCFARSRLERRKLFTGQDITLDLIVALLATLDQHAHLRGSS